ncbi:MAG: hypothetical protein FJ030_04705 [Chloroflexi bacterium]|nr:hypothetical protein [Chloroflexota bacterium]
MHCPTRLHGGPDLTIRCPFCGNAVIVPPELRTAAAPPAPPAADSAPQTLGQLPQWAEIGRLVKEGKKAGSSINGKSIKRIRLCGEWPLIGRATFTSSQMATSTSTPRPAN